MRKPSTTMKAGRMRLAGTRRFFSGCCWTLRGTPASSRAEVRRAKMVSRPAATATQYLPRS